MIITSYYGNDHIRKWKHPGFQKFQSSLLFLAYLWHRKLAVIVVKCKLSLLDQHFPLCAASSSGVIHNVFTSATNPQFLGGQRSKTWAMASKVRKSKCCCKQRFHNSRGKLLDLHRHIQIPPSQQSGACFQTWMNFTKNWKDLLHWKFF